MNLFKYVFLYSLTVTQEIPEKKMTPINLLILAKHYKLHGNAILYTGLLKILSSKLK